MGRDRHFEEIMQAHGVMISRIAASYEANPFLRQELEQDIITAIWRALPGFRAEASIRTFLARIAHNRAISHVARAANEPKLSTLDDNLRSSHPTPFEEVERNDQQERLMCAVRSLPLSAREPVVLTLEGFTPREIAAMLDLTPNVVSIRLTRAKEMLRAALANPACTFSINMDKFTS